MNKVFFTSSFVIRMSVLLLLLAVALLSDAHFIAGCRHAFASAVSSCTSTWLSFGKWYHSWPTLARTFPPAYALYLAGKLLLSHHARLRRSRHIGADGNIENEYTPAERRTRRILGEAGRLCWVGAYLNVLFGLPTVWQAPAFTMTAFLVVNAFSSKLKDAAERFDEDYAEDPREMVRLGERLTVEEQGLLASGRVILKGKRAVLMDWPDPTDPTGKRRTITWVPYSVLENCISEHTAPYEGLEVCRLDEHSKMFGPPSSELP
jgi:hypothetical protein